jgi:hypothetical protein
VSAYDSMKAMDAAETARDLVVYLRARADWFMAERLAGGSQVLREREIECRYLANKVENVFSAPLPQRDLDLEIRPHAHPDKPDWAEVARKDGLL